MNSTLAGTADGSVTRRVNPLRLVATKEWLDLRRDTRWRVLLGITVILMMLALLLCLQREHRLEQAHDQAEAADRAVWTAQGAKNPHAAAHFGQYAFKPLGPLAVADPGIDAYVGNAVWLEAHKQNQVQFPSARDGTLASRLGQLTLAGVLQQVLPLMALLLGFAAVSGEREQGTLRQLLSLGVSPWQWMAGKALAHATVLLLLLALAVGGLLLGLSLEPWVAQALGQAAPEHERPDLPLGRLLGLGAAYGLYLLTFLLLAMALSALLRQSRSALICLLAFWLMNGFLLPRVLSEQAAQATPLPTAQAFREAVAADKKKQFGHDESHPGFLAFKQRVLQQYGVSRVDDLPVSFRGVALREDDELGYKIFDLHMGRLQALLDRQDQQLGHAGWAVPLLALQPLSMALAGTDNRHHHDFVRAAESHRRQLQTLVSQDLIANAGNRAEYKADAILWAAMPYFSYVAPDARWALRDLASHWLQLGAWMLGAAGLLAWATRRLSPL